MSLNQHHISRMLKTSLRDNPTNNQTQKQNQIHDIILPTETKKLVIRTQIVDQAIDMLARPLLSSLSSASLPNIQEQSPHILPIASLTHSPSPDTQPLHAHAHTTLACHIVHECTNILTSISLRAQLAQEHLNQNTPPATLHHHFRLIEDLAIESAKRLTHSFCPLMPPPSEKVTINLKTSPSSHPEDSC